MKITDPISEQSQLLEVILIFEMVDDEESLFTQLFHLFLITLQILLRLNRVVLFYKLFSIEEGF